MKAKISIALLGLLLTITTVSSHATSIDDKRPLKERIGAMTDEEKKVRLEEIRSRVDEIKNTDKSSLTRAERKAMKKELREMNKEAKTMRGGVYLSVGAIIIIILLLILIL